ncbi:HAD-IA family hydrolase [Clostridium sp.]|uniref:HAD family hydrolase n=1 Tax=Clostridium sp. TaxID=1506 RepID=UPI0032177026
MDKLIFWDFQGTLAHNEWMISKALYKVLCKYEPYTEIGIEDFKKIALVGFPWQQPEEEYMYLTSSDAWWKRAEDILTNGYMKLNVSEEKAAIYSKEIRQVLVSGESFQLYEDTTEVLQYFMKKGFSNVILSNHIPELSEIVEKLGLSPYIIDCISSANVGYEKPNPKIYYYALKKHCGYKDIWMVGDSILADVRGPEYVGIQAVLVRNKMEENVRYYSKDLLGVKEIIK